MSKAAKFIPLIMQAKTQEAAKDVIYGLFDALHLTPRYVTLVLLKDDLKEHEERFKTITDGYDNSPRTIEDMMNTRMSLNFLYRDSADKFSFEVNSKKISVEEGKVVAKSQALLNIKDDHEVQERIKATSTAALKDLLGVDAEYKKYVAEAAITYGMYQQLQAYLNSIRMFIDYLASAIRQEQLIIQNDPK